jgi:hypothetical protein
MIPAEDFTGLVSREHAAFGDGPLFDVTEMIARCSVATARPSSLPFRSLENFLAGIGHKLSI